MTKLGKLHSGANGLRCRKHPKSDITGTCNPARQGTLERCGRGRADGKRDSGSLPNRKHGIGAVSVVEVACSLVSEADNVMVRCQSQTSVLNIDDSPQIIFSFYGRSPIRISSFFSKLKLYKILIKLLHIFKTITHHKIVKKY